MSLLDEMKRKELRRLIGHFLKLNQQMTGSSKMLTQLQVNELFFTISRLQSFQGISKKFCFGELADRNASLTSNIKSIWKGNVETKQIHAHVKLWLIACFSWCVTHLFELCHSFTFQSSVAHYPMCLIAGMDFWGFYTICAKTVKSWRASCDTKRYWENEIFFLLIPLEMRHCCPPNLVPRI